MNNSKTQFLNQIIKAFELAEKSYDKANLSGYHETAVAFKHKVADLYLVVELELNKDGSTRFGYLDFYISADSRYFHNYGARISGIVIGDWTHSGNYRDMLDDSLITRLYNNIGITENQFNMAKAHDVVSSYLGDLRITDELILALR